MKEQKQIKILLVEDDYIDVESFKRELKKFRIAFELTVAHNGHEALDSVVSMTRDALPDLIVLDVNLPKMNGYEFLSIIKNYHNLKDIHIYVLSTSVEEYDRILIESLGAEGFLIKPLRLGEQSQESPSLKKFRSTLLAYQQ